MNKFFSSFLSFVFVACLTSPVFAAELLNVKPVATGDKVAIEITADTAMTYTYYKVPGQPRAVVDIAEANPEKVEPLIVVNKGAVSSISVDQAEISGMVVSRVIFNLVSEADISVTASDDHKLLTVTFGGAVSAGKSETKTAPLPESVSEPTPEPKPEPVLEPAQAQPEEPVAGVEQSANAADSDDDPFGVDEPTLKDATPAVAPVAVPVTAPKATAVVAAPVVNKLIPVVPVSLSSTNSTSLSIKDIETGSSYIEIQANQRIAGYKSFKLSNPERLIIDISSPKINQKAKTVAIKKFGITNARIGISPKNIRIVLDTIKSSFPVHTISETENGLRINFK